MAPRGLRGSARFAALTACIVRALGQQDEAFQARFKENLSKVYDNIRDMELSARWKL